MSKETNPTRIYKNIMNLEQITLEDITKIEKCNYEKAYQIAIELITNDFIINQGEGIFSVNKEEIKKQEEMLIFSSPTQIVKENPSSVLEELDKIKKTKKNKTIMHPATVTNCDLEGTLDIEFSFEDSPQQILIFLISAYGMEIISDFLKIDAEDLAMETTPQWTGEVCHFTVDGIALRFNESIDQNKGATECILDCITKHKGIVAFKIS